MSVIVGPTLPEPYYGTVEGIWEDVAAEFGDSGIVNPYPHFTLYHLDDADLAELEGRVREVATRHDPVPVRTDGVGVFPGDHVYLPVTHSESLGSLHRDVVGAIDGLGDAPTPHYEPGSWFPHVALACSLDRDQAPEVVSFLLDYDLAWEFAVEEIAITRREEGDPEHEMVATVDL